TEADIVWQPVDDRLTKIIAGDQPWEENFDEDDLFLQTQFLLDQMFAHKLSAHLQIHAGAVVAPSGKAWIICGESGAGKTSLTLTLILNGWQWLSDEFAMLSREKPGFVLPFPRNFNIKEYSFVHFPETAGLA